MKKLNLLKLTGLVLVLALLLMACSSNDEEPTNDANETEEQANGSDEGAVETVEITDAHGTVTVPVNPQNVVALDNRTFETLADWGIELSAAPIDLIPTDNPYSSDESILNVGNHREPNLEVIAEVNPDLVIVGQRFASFYEDIKELVPQAVVVDFNIDVSEEAATPGDNLLNGFKDVTTSLGLIFDKNEEAEALIAEFDQAVEDAKAAYNGTDTIMSIIVSGGEIGFSAPNVGRVWGPLYDILELTPALEIDAAGTDHQGDDISVEAIAESNPDWIFVLDRDAGTTTAEESVPAQDVIENSPALQNTTAISEGQILYAPSDTYTNESIQTFIEIFRDITDAFSK